MRHLLALVLILYLIFGVNSQDNTTEESFTDWEEDEDYETGSNKIWRTVEVETKYGTLRGLKQVSREGRGYYSFQGIPYAKSPIGYLRYEPPQPPKPWKGIREATSFGSQCMQISLVGKQVVGSEDCLFLNVYTHRFYDYSSNYQGQLNPVLVFLHGGIFMFGSANVYRAKYFLDENVVLVTLNYRLNSFGFLNTGDGIIQGNMGLKDQTMALKWIRENIATFGGDPTRITLMGESAGSASSHLHTLSPTSKNLFQRAISMSGTALAPWALIKNPGSQAKEFAYKVGCPTRVETSKMVRCLKSLDSKTLTKAHIGYINGLADDQQSIFGPTIERVSTNPFLPQHPKRLMKSGNINNVTWLTGVNSEEGLVYLIAVMHNSTMLRLLNTNWSTYGPKFLQLDKHYLKSPNFLQDVRSFYLNDSDISLSTLRAAARMTSDSSFFLDNHDAVIYHSRVAPVYPYYYTYNGRFAMAKLLFVRSKLPFRIPDRYDFYIGAMESWFKDYVLGIREPNKYGIGHSDELPIFFNVPLMRRPILDSRDEDYRFSKIMVKLWVSFAERGVPDTKSLNLPRWNPVIGIKKNVPLKRYQLDGNPRPVEEPFYKRLLFWKQRGHIREANQVTY